MGQTKTVIEEMDEQQLIEGAQGNSEKFELLYRRYYKPVLVFVYRRMEIMENAYEVTSCVFAKALLNIKKYQYRGVPFSSWLFKIALNEVSQFYRDSKKNRVVSVETKSVKNIADETNVNKEEWENVLKVAIQHLDEDEIQLIELRYFEERPFAEVATILGITENNAKVKTYRVIDRLKSIFKNLS
jgi:RNA polymerase sigma-70 factor (ECF subfamily)